MITIVGILENGEQHIKRSSIFTEAESKRFVEAAAARGHGGKKYRRFFVIQSDESEDGITDVQT